ncbi:TPA: hypothetical protein N0F65_009910 [Lagenidium giganteum]|uniref:DUF547 domain-containing protein n=1 Tax=Lagenidium giganteum TaxID=4803 RepID=A0AAV2YKG1_9STRA|nr:TPA: hypothetical protein N0F65_009910 [Lagenidium giganteum]
MQQRVPMLSDESLLDLALLSTLSVLVHYCFGFYGLAVALLVYCGGDRSDQAFRRLSDFLLDAFHDLYWHKLLRSPEPEEDKSDGHDHGGSDTDDQARAPSPSPSSLPASPAARSPAPPAGTATSGASISVSSDSADEMAVPHTPVRHPLRDAVGPHAHQWQVQVRDVAGGAASTSVPSPVMCINANAPMPFETELFNGHVLILVRTNPEDPRHTHLFAGRRRMFWIQVQGQFKRQPQGTVFLGGELPARVATGFFTRSIALVIMGIIKKLVRGVHFSFGDSRRGEVPHVAFPLFQSVDQFVATRAGEQPPTLGTDDFGESDEARKQRRSTPLGQENYEVGVTYSFHFHTMYVDLTTWTTKNLPGMSDMDLATFFDSLPLRLSAYDIDTAAATSDHHCQVDKRYVFCFELQHERRRLQRSESEQSDQSASSTAGSTASIENATENEVRGSESDELAGATASADAVPMPARGVALEMVAALHADNASKLKDIDISFLFWMEEVDLASAVRRVHYVLTVRRRTNPETSHIAVVSAFALRLLLFGSSGSRAPADLRGVRFHSRSRIGSYSTITAEAEQISQYLKGMLNTIASGAPTAFDQTFQSSLYRLLHSRVRLEAAPAAVSCTPSKLGVNLTKRDRIDMRVALEGIVYRFHTDSLLRQEVLVVTANELLFYRSYSTNPDKIVQCGRVIGVEACSSPWTKGHDDGNDVATSDGDTNTTTPQAPAYAFTISTFAEEITLCVHADNARKSWIRVILQQCNPQANLDQSLVQDMHVCATPNKALQPADRVVLNSRSLFPGSSDRKNTNSANAGIDAVALAATTLRSALRIHAGADKMSALDVMAFLDKASLFRAIDLTVLHQRPHEDKLSFYLNLYHIILAHAMIAIGFPRGKTQWTHFLTHMCYSVGIQRRTMSLAEIEHVILRARLPRAELPYLAPSFFQRRSAALLTTLGLAHPDFRVTFALVLNNCYSDRVVVFQSACVHDQLNAVAKRFLGRQVEVQVDKRAVVLPRVCEWYRHDYGGHGSSLYCLRKLVGFLPEETQAAALTILDSSSPVRVKFASFKYSSRAVLRLDTSLEDEASGLAVSTGNRTDDESAAEADSSGIEEEAEVIVAVSGTLSVPEDASSDHGSVTDEE